MNEDDTSISKPITPTVNGNTNMSGDGIAKDTECSHKNNCNEEPSIKSSAQDDNELAATSIELATNGTNNSKEDYPTINNSLSIQQNHFESLPSASTNEKDTVSKSMDINDKKKPSIPHGFGIMNSTSSIQGDEMKQTSMLPAGLANNTANDKDMVEDTKMSALKSNEGDISTNNNSDSDNSEEDDNTPIGMVGKPKRKEVEELEGTDAAAAAAASSSKEEIATPPQTNEIQSNNNIDGIKSEVNDTNQQMRKRKTTFDQVEGATKVISSSCVGASSPLLAKPKQMSSDNIKDKEKDPSPLRNPWDTQDADNNKQSPVKTEGDISIPKDAAKQQNGNNSSSMKKEEEAEEELEYSDTEKIGKGGKPLCKAKGCQKYKQGKHGLCATHFKVSSPSPKKQSSAVTSPRRSPKRRGCKMEEDEEEVEFVSSSTPTRSKRARITTDRLDPSPSVSKRRTTAKSNSSTAIVVSEDKEESDDDDDGESDKEEEISDNNEEEEALEYSDTENKKGKGGRLLCKAKSCQKCSQGAHGLCARHFKVSSQYERKKKKKTSQSPTKSTSPKRARSNSTSSTASSDKKKSVSDIRREAAKLGWERKKQAEESPPQDKRKISKRLFDIGQRVEAIYEGIGDEWYTGTVVGRGQGSYDIDYDDGDKDRKLHARFVRVLDEEEEDEDSWKCHKCETVNPTSKSRCRACLGWKGGSRSPIKKTAVTKPPAATKPSTKKKFIPLERPSNKKNGRKRSNSDLDNTDEVTYSNNGRVQRARKKPDTFNPQAGAAKDWRPEGDGNMKVSWDDSPSIQKPPRKKRAIQAASDDFFGRNRRPLIVEGSNVVVEEFPLGRGTWSAGGAGRVMNVHESIDGSVKYDIEYFVGGEEMGIDEKYVTAAKNWLEEKDSALDDDYDFSFSEMELPEGNAERVGSAAPRREVAMDVDLTNMSETAMYERTRFELLNGRDFWICTHCAIAMSSITSPCSRCKRKISFIPLEEEEFETFVRQQRETNRQKAEQWRLQWEQKVNGMKEEDWSDHEKQDEVSKKPKSKPVTLDHYKQKSKYGSIFCQYMGCQATAHPSSEGFCREHYKVVQEDADPAPYPLLFPEDAILVTDSIFLTYSQMVPSTYGKSDRKGVYGFPGMACKHCIGKGKGHTGRFFASSESSMYVASFTKSINNHLIGCTYCPDEVRLYYC